MPTDAATTTAAIATVRPHRRGGFGARLGVPSVDLPQHRRGPDRVAVAQRGVVGVVDVAGVVFTFEIGQRTQQEPALLLEFGELVEIHPRRQCRACPAGARRLVRRPRIVGERRGDEFTIGVGRIGGRRRLPLPSPEHHGQSRQTTDAVRRRAAPRSARRSRVERGTSSTCAPYLVSMNATMSASDRSFSLTSSVISLRIARDALFCDTNTLSPAQIGHATRLAIASTRSPWRGRDPTSGTPRRRGSRPPRTPATPIPATA